MKKVLLLLLMLPLLTKAQKIVDRVTMPTKDSTVFYEQIVEVDSLLSKDEIFLRSSKWIADKFLDSKEAVKLSDKDQGKIVGKGLFSLIYNKFGTYDDYVSFDFDITIKKGKYRIQFYGIEVKGIGSDYPFAPMERSYFRQLNEDKFSFRKDYVRLCRMADQKFNELLNDFKLEIGKHPSTDDF